MMLITLRHNVGVESDLKLARAELQSLVGNKASIHEIADLNILIDLLDAHHADENCKRLLCHQTRSEGVIAFFVEGATASGFNKVVSRMAFAQEIAYFSKSKIKTDNITSKLSRFTVTDVGITTRAVTLCALLDYSTKLVFSRNKGEHVGDGLNAILNYLLDNIIPEKSIRKATFAAIAAKKTTLYLTHELHLYKGKFFPRMVRSLLNRYLTNENAIVVDPFVGSGTTLLESSLLGFNSIGIDVDPTSVLISQCKLAPSTIDTKQMASICQKINLAVSGNYECDLFSSSDSYSLDNWERHRIDAPEPMRSRLIKRGNEEGYDLLSEVENDSAKVLCLINQAPSKLRPLLRVCLSHALTKKLRLRFVGIGNGRFTIDVAKSGVLEMFVKKAFHLVAITEVFEWIQAAGIELSRAEVHRGSAKNFSSYLGERKADLILTSPPYIPASSGREHYARARAIPLVFTKAATLDELDTLDQAFIGEMSALNDTLHLEEMMPPTIRSTLHFLRNDAQRLPKYLPTLNYYVDLERVLEQTRESLSKTGRALYVVGTSHTFYIHKTKQILYTVDASKALAELGQKAGLVVEEIINIPLKKSGGLNARPRSTDDYSESVVVFKRKN